MQDSNKPKNNPQVENTADSVPSHQDYRDHNSGRRAAGHGGGDLDRPDDLAGARHEDGYDYRGGGSGDEPGDSLAKETDEDMESRDGPFTRAGRPAASDKPSDK